MSNDKRLPSGEELVTDLRQMAIDCNKIDWLREEEICFEAAARIEADAATIASLSARAESTDKITQEEMIEMFGTDMPIEAVKLLWSSPPEKTFGELRAELRAIGKKRAALADQPPSPPVAAEPVAEATQRAREIVAYAQELEGLAWDDDTVARAEQVAQLAASPAALRLAAKQSWNFDMKAAPRHKTLLIFTPEPGEDWGYMDTAVFSTLTSADDYAWREPHGDRDIVSTAPTAWRELPTPPEAKP